jgi:Peptidase family M48
VLLLRVKRIRIHSFTLLLFLFALSAVGQIPAPPEIPNSFKLDMQTAARLRPQFMADSEPPGGRYSTGELVFKRLLQFVPSSAASFKWQLRIVDNDQLNAYASPDGGIYVESGLGGIAGQSAGLWAAILSHEIAHVVRRDWARRYLYQKYLERGGGSRIVLGDPGLPPDTWFDSEKASADMGRFCRQLELISDRDGLMMMARAGYHPDFVPALHHLLHAQGVAGSKSLYAMHPCWEERDQELTRAYTEASIEFEHRWREWYSSPGGNPPVVVFANEPTVKKVSGGRWQIQVPMRCENLVGAVEVVLRSDAQRNETMRLGKLPDKGDNASEVRQLTGCTSPTTTVTFPLMDGTSQHQPQTHWTDIYVVDAWGSVLAREDMPKSPR